jgi:DNA polymerase III delta subunit
MKKKVFSFDSYLEGIKAFETKLVRGQPSVALSFGTCPFLISESIHYLQKKATLSQIEHRLMDLSEGQGKGLQDLWNQAGLFASHSLYIVYGLERSKEGLRQFLSLSGKPSSHSFLFSYPKAETPKGLSDLVDQVWCQPPLYQNLKKAIEWTAFNLDLKIEEEGIQALIHLHGSDLNGIKNALMITQLQRPDQKKITGAQLLEQGVFLREDESLRLSHLILEGAKAEALLLLHDLTERGESSLGILGIMSRLCRTSLASLDRGYQGNLPPMVARQYANYGRKQGMNSLALALRKCSDADISLKSGTKASDYHILANLLNYL